ncbi:MAG: MFS transporter [Geminicoccaceae bacterium]|nr:MAG: MFS transporter [Geminicoccaceae bacterium]
MSPPETTSAVAPGAVDVRPVVAIIAMAAVFGVLQGLTYPLFALLLERQGVGATVIGLNAAMMPLGLIAAAPFVPDAARRIGARRLAVLACLLLAAALLVMGASEVLWVWFIGRFLLGIGINAIYVVSETWLNLMIPRAQRGRWLALYATMLGAGFAAGPALLLATGIDGFAPFFVAIVFALVTAGLIVAAHDRLPRFHIEHGMTLFAFMPLAPLLLAAVAAAAAFDQAVLTFLPLYTLAFGASETAAKLAITALALGNVLLQMPIGWLADRVSRKAATLTCTFATVAGAALLPAVAEPGPWLWLLVFLWGGFAYGTYTVALVELGDRFTGSTLLAGNAAFAMMWGMAGLVGPTASGIAIDAIGPNGLPLVVAIAFAALSLAYWYRRPPLDRAPSLP